MAFEQPSEFKETKLVLKTRSWWLGRTIDLEMTGPAGSVNEFARNHVPLGTKEKKVKDGLETN